MPDTNDPLVTYEDAHRHLTAIGIPLTLPQVRNLVVWTRKIGRRNFAPLSEFIEAANERIAYLRRHQRAIPDAEHVEAAGLTKHQLEILRRRRDGEKFKGIASDLGVTPTAVRTAYLRAERKLDSAVLSVKCPNCGTEVRVP